MQHSSMVVQLIKGSPDGTKSRIKNINFDKHFGKSCVNVKTLKCNECGEKVGIANKGKHE